MEQTGWWFKIRERDPQFVGQENAQAKAASQRHACREGSLAKLEEFWRWSEHKLAIEIEGSVHDDVVRRDYDAERHAYLESHGIRVLYFENRVLLELSDYVVGVIRSAVLEPPPRPLH